MLALVAILNLFERIENNYKIAWKKLGYKSKMKNTEMRNYLMENMMMISQDSLGKRFDGFPMVLVLIDIVSKALELIKEHPFKAVSKYHRKELRNITQDQAIFDQICTNYFDDNVYHCFNEFVYHATMNFL